MPRPTGDDLHAAGASLGSGEAAASVVTRIPASSVLLSRVQRDHATIRALLDAVERACAGSSNRQSAGLDSLRRAVWDLYIAFVEHLAMEEEHVAPILRSAGGAGEARAVAMMLEHNEQRRLILELVDDMERDAKEADALVVEALALVGAFNTDMLLEDRSLAPLLDDRSMGD